MMPDGVEQALTVADRGAGSAFGGVSGFPSHSSREALRTRCSAKRIVRGRRRATVERGTPSARRRGLPGARAARAGCGRGRILGEEEDSPGGKGDRRGGRRRGRSSSALASAATARVALHEVEQRGRTQGADTGASLATTARPRDPVGHHPGGARVVARASALGDAGAARTILTETERVLELRPNLGSLVEDARELKGSTSRRLSGRPAPGR